MGLRKFFWIFDVKQLEEMLASGAQFLFPPAALRCHSIRLGAEEELLGEENWILQLGKGPPRAPLAREAARRTPRGGSRPPDPPPARKIFSIFDLEFWDVFRIFVQAIHL